MSFISFFVDILKKFLIKMLRLGPQIKVQSTSKNNSEIYKLAITNSKYKQLCQPYMVCYIYMVRWGTYILLFRAHLERFFNNIVRACSPHIGLCTCKKKIIQKSIKMRAQIRNTNNFVNHI